MGEATAAPAHVIPDHAILGRKMDDLEIAISKGDYQMTLQAILRGNPVYEQLVYDSITIHNWGLDTFSNKKIAPLLIAKQEYLLHPNSGN